VRRRRSISGALGPSTVCGEYSFVLLLLLLCTYRAFGARIALDIPLHTNNRISSRASGHALDYGPAAERTNHKFRFTNYVEKKNHSRDP